MFCFLFFFSLLTVSYSQDLTDFVSAIPSSQAQLLTSVDTDYPQLKTIWNPLFQTDPELIVRPLTENGVVFVVKEAKKRNIKLRMRTGGNSFAGYGTTTGVILDLRLLDHVDVNLDMEMVTLGGGVQVGQVEDLLRETDYIMMTATSPQVGMASYFSGGGHSYLNGAGYGMGIDNVISFHLVTSEGQLLEVNENTNADLWWAVRGSGAGNWGVITQIEYKLIKHEGVISRLFVSWVETEQSTVMNQFFSATAKWRESSVGDKLGDVVFSISVLPTGKVVGMSFVYDGPEAEFRALDILADFSANYAADPAYIERRYYAEQSQQEKTLSGDLTTFPSPIPVQYAAVSLPNVDIPESVQNEILQGIPDVTVQQQGVFGTTFVIWKKVWNLGTSSDYAFPINNMGYEVAIALGFLFDASAPPAKQFATDWANNFVDTLPQQLTQHGSALHYPNYMHELFSDETWVELLYGENFYRLQQIKKKYDPGNYWTFPRSIPFPPRTAPPKNTFRITFNNYVCHGECQ